MPHPDHVHDHHHHGGGSAPPDFNAAFALGIALNVGFVIIEAFFGILSNSMALLADAGHNMSDVLGLMVAWIAVRLSARPPGGRFTYGLKSSSVLAALINASILLIAVGGIAWEALMRFGSPEPVAGWTVIVVAVIGIIINAFTAWLFASGGNDVNVRGAFLHMAADAAVSAGVVIAGFAMLQTGWLWLDPAVSLAITVVIFWATWGLLRESLALSMNAAPASVDLQAVRKFLLARPGVSGLHDLHVWPLGTSETALSVHLEMPGGNHSDGFLLDVSSELQSQFNIGHPTIQIESGAESCPLAPDKIV